MQDSNSRQAAIRLGTHGEDYGNWMPVSMLRLVGGLLVLAAVLAGCSGQGDSAAPAVTGVCA